MKKCFFMSPALYIGKRYNMAGRTGARGMSNKTRRRIIWMILLSFLLTAIGGYVIKTYLSAEDAITQVLAVYIRTAIIYIFIGCLVFTLWTFVKEREGQERPEEQGKKGNDETDITG